jgi:hypothetical protein
MKGSIYALFLSLQEAQDLQLRSALEHPDALLVAEKIRNVKMA